MPLNQIPDPSSDQPLSWSLNQKVALVTSSRSGVCASTAIQLASVGAKVMICGRNANQGLATVRQIRSEGGRATFVLADTAVIADVQAVVDETIATYGRLDILFNHISNRYPQDGPVATVSESVWDRVVEPLLKGTFFCCQYALPFLQQGDRGTIINLIEKLPGDEPQTVSAICQGGVLAMTRAIAQQFAATTVTANIVWAAPIEIASSETAEPGYADLLMSQILTGPAVAIVSPVDSVADSPPETRPFADVAEAVMYLAHHGTMLHGSALVVNTAGPRA